MGDHAWSATEPSKEFSVASKHLAECLRDRRTLLGLEGGVVYSGTYNGYPCLVTDEGTLMDLSPELGRIDPHVRLFESNQHREAYISRSGLSDIRSKWRWMRLSDLRRQIEETYSKGGLERGEKDQLLARLSAFQEGFPVGGLDVAERDLLPDHFEFRTFAMMGSERIVWNGDAFVETRESHQGWDDRPPRSEFQPSAPQWRTFWRAIGRMGAWRWPREVDVTDEFATDRGGWELNLARAGQKVIVRGEFPWDSRGSCYSQVQRALNRLFKGWPDEGHAK